AVWVPVEYRATAELAGATLVERAAVVTTHLAEMVRRNAARLLGLDDVRELLDVLKAERPAAVEEVVPGLLPLAGGGPGLHRRWRGCSACCTACWTSRSRSATWHGYSRGSASEPGPAPTPTPCSKPPGPAWGPR